MSIDTKIPTMLEEMVGAAEEEVARRQAETSWADLERMLGQRGQPRPFREALTRQGLSVIAEFKRRSPSENNIAATAKLANQVLAYQRGGAAALSVLTHGKHFGGELRDLREARDASELPILRKDFIVDRYQLLEAAAFGADAVLLIAAVLGDDALDTLFREAQELDLDCIVEVRTTDEMARALRVDADIIGINNRDLRTLAVDVNNTFELLKQVPTGKTVVSESGIERADQITRLREAGVDAVLIGHWLMRSEEPQGALEDLLSSDDVTREHLL